MTKETVIVTRIESWFEEVKNLKYSELIVVCDDNTALHCLPYFKEKYLPNQTALELQVTSGEKNKTLDQVQFLWSRLLDKHVSRNAVLICLGGGMVSDLAGFAANTYKRGIRTINVPTTNLAMTDASIGGKTGINFGHIKNQVGTFHFPEIVLIDCQFLESLSEKEIKSGYAETIKHALIADPELWQNIQNNLWLEMAKNEALILRSMRIKQRIFESDVNDIGIRQALNFGHTIGHAFEAHSHQTQRPLLHGEAIALGIIAESYLSMELCGLNPGEFQKIERFITSLFDYSNFPVLDPKGCIEFMRNDKKNSSSVVRFSLIEKIGAPSIGVEVDESKIESAMAHIQSLIKP